MVPPSAPTAPVEDAVGPASGGGDGGEAEGSGPAGGQGSGIAAGASSGSSYGISHHCPGEGRLGGGGGILSASPTPFAGGQPSGEGVLGTATGVESGGPFGAFVDAAAHAGPLVLAVFALGALLLLVGLAGGVRALNGRLRSG